MFRFQFPRVNHNVVCVILYLSNIARKSYLFVIIEYALHIALSYNNSIHFALQLRANATFFYSALFVCCCCPPRSPHISLTRSPFRSSASPLSILPQLRLKATTKITYFAP